MLDIVWARVPSLFCYKGMQVALPSLSTRLNINLGHLKCSQFHFQASAEVKLVKKNNLQDIYRKMEV